MLNQGGVHLLRRDEHGADPSAGLRRRVRSRGRRRARARAGGDVARPLGRRDHRGPPDGVLRPGLRRARPAEQAALMVQAFSTWLHGTKLSWAVAGGVPWIWPLCETLHFMGLALLTGVVGVLDLRMLGMAKGLPLAPLQRLMPWAVVGFTINLITGVLFFAGDPFQYTHNVAFAFKLLFIGLAGVNVMLFHVTGLSRKVDNVAAGHDVPPAAK